MDFSRRKLPKDVLQSLYRVKVETIRPFALMIGPVYLYFKANEKFVSVKGPLDFFTESELMKLKGFKYFYLPEFVATALPFREAGQKVKEILSAQETLVEDDDSENFPQIALPPTPYEMSDEILRILGPLWWEIPKQGTAIEPYMLTVFVNALCELLPKDSLLGARERSVEKLDFALFRSSWAVFLALLLGYCDLEFLNDLRIRVFEMNIAGTLVAPINWKLFRSEDELPSEMDEIIEITHLSMVQFDPRIIKADVFSKRSEKVAHKLTDRIERIKKEFVSRGKQPPSIFGKRGFIDV